MKWSKVTWDYLSAFEENERIPKAIALRHFKKDPVAIGLYLQHQYWNLYQERSKNNNYHNSDEVHKSYVLFQRACENILDTYFPLLSED